MTNEPDHSPNLTLHHLEELSVSLLHLSAHLTDRTWVLQQSVEELIALMNAALASIAAMWPLIQPSAHPTGVVAVTAAQQDRVRALAKQAKYDDRPATRGRPPRPRRSRAASLAR